MPLLTDTCAKHFSLILTTVEMAVGPQVNDFLISLGTRMCLLVFDEAHCVAEWYDHAVTVALFPFNEISLFQLSISVHF